jgi:hypothetical protein
MAKKAKKAVKAKKAAKKSATFGVSIQKVLEKMKAIVDNNKEAEFLAKCEALKEDRFVTVNSRIVKLVKKFELAHGLKPKRQAAAHAGAAAAGPSMASSSDGETCFKH